MQAEVTRGGMSRTSKGKAVSQRVRTTFTLSGEFVEKAQRLSKRRHDGNVSGYIQSLILEDERRQASESKVLEHLAGEYAEAYAPELQRALVGVDQRRLLVEILKALPKYADAWNASDCSSVEEDDGCGDTSLGPRGKLKAHESALSILPRDVARVARMCAKDTFDLPRLLGELKADGDSAALTKAGMEALSEYWMRLISSGEFRFFPAGDSVSSRIPHRLRHPDSSFDMSSDPSA